MALFEFTDTFDYPASAVFALLTDLSVRPDWIQGTFYEIRVTPEGPARLGTSYFESGKFSGFKSEKTLLVTEYEQDRLLTLASEDSAKQPWRETYRIEPLSEEACRVHFTFDVGNVPKVAEFFMRQQMKKDQPQNTARLKSLLAASQSTEGKLIETASLGCRGSPIFSPTCSPGSPELHFILNPFKK